MKKINLISTISLGLLALTSVTSIFSAISINNQKQIATTSSDWTEIVSPGNIFKIKLEKKIKNIAKVFPQSYFSMLETNETLTEFNNELNKLTSLYFNKKQIFQAVEKTHFIYNNVNWTDTQKQTFMISSMKTLTNNIYAYEEWVMLYAIFYENSKYLTTLNPTQTRDLFYFSVACNFRNSAKAHMDMNPIMDILEELTAAGNETLWQDGKGFNQSILLQLLTGINWDTDLSKETIVVSGTKNQDVANVSYVLNTDIWDKSYPIAHALLMDFKLNSDKSVILNKSGFIGYDLRTKAT